MGPYLFDSDPDPAYNINTDPDTDIDKNLFLYPVWK